VGKKVRVQLHGVSNNRGIKLDADATEGATVGENLFWPDGSVVTEDELQSSTTTETTITTSTIASTLWELIQNIPRFISSLANLTGLGLIVRTGDGQALERTIVAEDSRISVVNGNGVAGNPTIGMTDWPIVKNTIETGDAAHIFEGFQMIVMDAFTFNGGSLTIDGQMYVLDDQPVQGWRDLEGTIDTIAGANNPTPTIIGSGPFYAYGFDYTPQEDECRITFHIPHDIVPSTIYFHTHWMTDGTDTNTVKWELTYTFAKGFDQEAFSTTGTTIYIEQAGPGTAYQHMVSESDAVTIPAMTEPDGLVLLHLKRIDNGGTNNADTVYLMEADIHYLSTNKATHARQPDFYA
jgi:hypothetical protein